MPFTNIATAGGVGSTVEIAEIETLANGTIIIGDGSGAPTTLAAFDTSTGTLKIANGGTGQTTASAAFGALKQAATDIATGVVELATDAETITGTDTARAVTPANIQAKVASDTAKGIVELAIASEINTGTDATRAVTPDSLAGSVMGSRSVEIVVFDYATNTATGDGKAYFTVPEELNGMNLISAHARVITAGTTNTTDIQIHNLTQTADMLTTKLTIDSAETGSDTGTPHVVDAANDDVATNDLLRIDVDAVSTTPAVGLILRMRFQLP